MKKTAAPESKTLSRRDFVRIGVIGGTAAAVAATLPVRADEKAAAPATPAAPVGGAKTDVWVFTGKNKKALAAAALQVIAKNGGFGQGITRMALKVNAGWARTPEQGANTHPELVDAFLEGAKKAGIKEIVLPELACAPAADSFKMSGIGAAAEKHGAKMIDLAKNRAEFVPVEIPNGKKLTKAKVPKDFLDPKTVIVNMPVAKHHGGAQLSIAMKNWMGSVIDRGFWHNNNLHQCIADFASFMKPSWTIIDATRIMTAKGPQGPGPMKEPNQIIVSKDQVAADAVASTLFVDSPAKIGYLKIAGESGIGVSDLDKINIIRQNV